MKLDSSMCLRRYLPINKQQYDFDLFNFKLEMYNNCITKTR